MLSFFKLNGILKVSFLRAGGERPFFFKAPYTCEFLLLIMLCVNLVCSLVGLEKILVVPWIISEGAIVYGKDISSTLLLSTVRDLMSFL